jgi:hypothetical protein
MMRRLTTLGSAFIVAALLVMGVDYASYAATGDSFILGQLNKAGTATTLERTTNGAALKLMTNNNGAAPIITNGQGKVTNFNADKVDGKNASAFARAARAPVAAGYINETGSVVHAWGLASASWDAANMRYVIDLLGLDFFYSEYAVNVTTICDNHEVRYGSVSNNLLVYITNNSATRVQCGFAFTVFKLPG